jgi:hypothetical protein
MSDLVMSDLKIKSDITDHQIRNFLNPTVAHPCLNASPRPTGVIRAGD